MSQLAVQLDVPPIVQRKLAQVRRGVRAYVWIEGLAAIVTTLALAFWLGLLLDWLFEPSPAVRLAAVGAVVALVFWIAYRTLFRRAFVRLPDASLAALLERRFHQFKDHLLTAVDLAQGDDGQATYHPELVARTCAAAAAAAKNVNAGQLFRRSSLVRRVVVAGSLALSIPLFALAASNTFGFWMERLALSPKLWPRRVHLAVLDFPADANGRRTKKLAHDDSFELVVHASTQNYVVPREVELRFRTLDGGRGRDSMIRVGDAVPGRDEFQAFRYEFEEVTKSMVLDVVGGDNRVEDLYLQIVDRPELVRMDVECVYPAYLGRAPRRLPITGGMRIPEGTTITLHATATKPLTDIRVQSSGQPQAVSLGTADAPIQEVRWEFGTLHEDQVLTIQITDTDGVTCREPYRISIAAIPDELPQVSVRLAGIGTAITPDAIIPLAGKVADDYGLNRVWCTYQVNSGPAQQRPLPNQPDGNQEFSAIAPFDTRGAETPTGELALQLAPGETLYLSVSATDRYDLTDTPRIGSSQKFALDVVTVAQLLALLERRELELRQRFEAAFAKMTDTRHLLSRVNFDTTEEAPATDSDSDTPVDVAERAFTRRRLRVAGALQNVTQSAHEVLGLATGFDDIHNQLENNRVDNLELKSRVREQIAQPLRLLGEKSMPPLERQLQLVSDRIADPQTGTAALADATRLADAVLVEMQLILDRMLELESYNEVVALLRGIIEDQESIHERTKRQQAERLEELFAE